VNFSRLGISLEFFFSKTRSLTVIILECGLITQKSRDLFERFLNKPRIRNYFCKGNLVDSVHGR
jgi:hypothetical protein